MMENLAHCDNEWIISCQHQVYIWEWKIKGLLNSGKKYGRFRGKVKEGLLWYIEGMGDCWDKHICPMQIVKEFCSIWVFLTSKVWISLQNFLCMLQLCGLLDFRVLHSKISMLLLFESWRSLLTFTGRLGLLSATTLKSCYRWDLKLRECLEAVYTPCFCMNNHIESLQGMQDLNVLNR